MAKFILTLTEDYSLKTYRLTEEMFLSLSTELEPFRSVSYTRKPVKCIETGIIYESAMCAVKQLGINPSGSNAEQIKKTCNGLKDNAFGFQWQYVNAQDKESSRTKKEKPKRWKFYANLKNETYSKSYKISKELFEKLSGELKQYCTSRPAVSNMNKKFKNIFNPFSDDIESINLTDAETAYIAILISGAGKHKALEASVLTANDLNALYKKFKLTDERFDRDAQLNVITALNGIVTIEILNDVYKKYKISKCRELIEMKHNAPEFKQKYKKQVNEVLKSFMDTVKERMF